MAPRYEKGQQIVVRPVENHDLSQRDFDLQPYAGQHGVVSDYYWISLGMGTRVVYVYTVQIEDGQKEVVLHEDEIEQYID